MRNLRRRQRKHLPRKIFNALTIQCNLSMHTGYTIICMLIEGFRSLLGFDPVSTVSCQESVLEVKQRLFYI